MVCRLLYGMRAAVYARVSTEDQAREGFSIAAQLKRLRAYCKAKGWDISDEYIDDGYSGRDISRPMYKKMMQESDSWDVLLVLKMDRIHRNSQNFTNMMNELASKGKQFSSMQEKFDTTSAMGRFVMDIIQRIAQLESEQIGERVKIGMVQKAKNGDGYLGSGEPYGYNFKDPGLEINPSEAGIVSYIFNAYISGNSLNDIAANLNSKGIPSKKGTTWKKQTVSKILRNPLYCGFASWDGFLIKLDDIEIVSISIFNLVQKMMEERRRNASGSAHTLIGG